MLSAFTKLYSSADNLVGVIYENFEQLGSSKLADIWTIRNITQKNFFGPGPLLQFASFKRSSQVWTTQG
jgi:hypothetical protein